MKYKIIAIALLFPLTLSAQNEIAEQKRKFESQKKAATAPLEVLHLESLLKIKEKYERAGNELLAELALKEAKDFLENKFHEETANTEWGPKDSNGSKMVFGPNRALDCFAPQQWFSGSFEIRSLDTIMFKDESNSWTMKFDFAKETAVVEQIGEGGRRLNRYNLIKKNKN